MLTYDNKTVGIVRVSVKEDCEAIAKDMRKQDIDESWSVSRFTPLQMAEYSFSRSLISMTIVHDVPIAMFGIMPDKMSSGILWMLTTNGIEKDGFGRVFVRNCRQWFKDMLEIYPELWGTVDMRNKVSIRWLTYLGCEWGKIINFGIDELPFIVFHFKKDKI